MKKYFKILLIPLLSLMFFIPVKADTLNLPLTQEMKNGQYVIGQYYTTYYLWLYDNSYDGTLSLGRGSSTSSTQWWRMSTQTVDGFIELYEYNSNTNSWVVADVTNKAYRSGFFTSSGYPRSENYTILYSSVNLKRSDTGSVLFEKKTVSPTVWLISKQPLNLMMEKVMTDSGEILAVGGLILGAVLVVLLVARLLRLATR